MSNTQPKPTIALSYTKNYVKGYMKNRSVDCIEYFASNEQAEYRKEELAAMADRYVVYSVTDFDIYELEDEEIPAIAGSIVDNPMQGPVLTKTPAEVVDELDESMKGGFKKGSMVMVTTGDHKGHKGKVSQSHKYSDGDEMIAIDFENPRVAGKKSAEFSPSSLKVIKETFATNVLARLGM